jgi:hypothetical protein
VALKLVTMCHLGPRTLKIKIWHPYLLSCATWVHTPSVVTHTCKQTRSFYLLLHPHPHSRLTPDDSTAILHRAALHGCRLAPPCHTRDSSSLAPICFPQSSSPPELRVMASSILSSRGAVDREEEEQQQVIPPRPCTTTGGTSLPSLDPHHAPAPLPASPSPRLSLGSGA